MVQVRSLEEPIREEGYLRLHDSEHLLLADLSAATARPYQIVRRSGGDYEIGTERRLEHYVVERCHYIVALSVFGVDDDPLDELRYRRVILLVLIVLVKLDVSRAVEGQEVA